MDVEDFLFWAHEDFDDGVMPNTMLWSVGKAKSDCMGGCYSIFLEGGEAESSEGELDLLRVLCCSDQSQGMNSRYT